MQPHHSRSAIAKVKTLWKPEYSERGTLLSLRKSFHKMLEATDQLNTNRVDVEKNTHLSDVGRRDALRKHAATETAPSIARARHALGRVEARLAERRQSLLPMVKDKGDVAAALLRREIRESITKVGDRVALLSDPDTDWRIIEAIIELPKSMSGIPPEMHGKMMDALIERTHPGALTDIAVEAEAIGVAKSAIEIANTTLFAAVNMAHATAFNEWFTAATVGSIEKNAAEEARTVAEGVLLDAKKLPVGERVSLVQSLLTTNSDELASKAAA